MDVSVSIPDPANVQVFVQKGDKGDTGATGEQGATGATGATGAQGATGLGYSGVTSTTSITIGAGLKTFTLVGSNQGAFTTGQRVRAIHSDTPTYFLEGNANYIGGGSLLITVDKFNGSGSHNSWNFAVAGEVGQTGATGATGATGVVTATAPITYDSGTQTVGITQSGLTLTQSQVTNLTTDLAAKVPLTGSSTITGTQTLIPSAAANVPLIVKGAASQANDYFAVKNSANTNLLWVDQYGIINTFGALLAKSNYNDGSAIEARGVSSQRASLITYTTSAGTVLAGTNAVGQNFTGSTAPILSAVGGATTATSGTGTTATITTTNAHNLAVGDLVTVAGVTPTGYNGTYVLTAVATNTISYANATTGSQTVAGTVSVPAQTSITARSAGTTGAVIRGAASQTADLLQLQNNAGSVLGAMSPGGSFGATNMRVNAPFTSGLGGGVGVLAINNATTVPTSNPNSGGVLYVESGTLKYRGPGGTITTIAVS